MSDTDKAGEVAASGTDRRVNVKLRSIFEQAYELIHPFFDPRNSWGGQPLDLMAFRALRELYPQLGSDEAEEVVAAAHHVYLTRHAPEGQHPFKK